MLKIIERCQWRIKNDPSFKLEELKRGKISTQILNYVYAYNTLDPDDQKILREFFETSDEIALSRIAKDKKEASGKVIFELLDGKTKNPQNDSLVDVCALLVDLQPRPFDRNFDYSSLNVKVRDDLTKKNKKSDKQNDVSQSSSINNNIEIHQPPISVLVETVGNNKNWLFLFAGLCLVAIVTIIYLSHSTSQDSSKASEPSVTINAENFVVSDVNKVIPNKDTQFFDKNNKPQIWYASHNNERYFYNTQGIDPITNKQLQPVTKEVIKTIFVEKENLNPEATTSIIKKTTSILNASIVNRKESTEISVFILDSTNTIDNVFSKRLHQEFKGKGYSVTPNLILPSKLNSVIIEHLKSGNFNYFNNEIKNHTDFICVGEVDYQFSKSTVLKDKITCSMTVSYSILSSITGEVIDTYSNSIKNYGSTKTIAKNNTIKKFTL